MTLQKFDEMLTAIIRRYGYVDRRGEPREIFTQMCEKICYIDDPDDDQDCPAVVIDYQRYREKECPICGKDLVATAVHPELEERLKAHGVEAG
jgi:hypothetical protein